MNNTNQQQDEATETGDLSSLFPESSYPYTRERVEAIKDSRRKLDDRLFFDLLATDVASISDAQDLYPPSDQRAIEDLAYRIANAPVDTLKKHCMLYYLQLDYNADNAKRYSESVMLPDAYRRYIDGVYALDKFEFTIALKHLTYPAVRLTYTAKILDTFLRYANEGARVVRIYVACTNAVLETREAMITYIHALSRLSLLSALKFVRSAPEEVVDEFLIMLVDFALAASPSNAFQIANLPLTLQEEHVVLAHLKANPDYANIRIVRELHRGHIAGAQAAAASRGLQHKISTGTRRKVQWAQLATALRVDPANIL
ncbi:nuclear pore complex assembly-domain-containing protein [Limtongia smithiae]|uniref:nuclear pore complex assembly-domain-containing protein n=1 Tax=Limtongia smithiae TaxID=1125753 RepID=UPI0034CFBEAF